MASFGVNPWGMDNLTLFVLAFDGKLIGANATTFCQYLRFPNRTKRGWSVPAKIEKGRLFCGLRAQACQPKGLESSKTLVQSSCYGLFRSQARPFRDRDSITLGDSPKPRIDL